MILYRISCFDLHVIHLMCTLFLLSENLFFIVMDIDSDTTSLALSVRYKKSQDLKEMIIRLAEQKNHPKVCGQEQIIGSNCNSFKVSADQACNDSLFSFVCTQYNNNSQNTCSVNYFSSKVLYISTHPKCRCQNSSTTVKPQYIYKNDV